jgi:ABC-2 type transport system ATP-binding protein
MREGVLLADDTPDGLRDRTHTPDVEQAFLRLIRETV